MAGTLGKPQMSRPDQAAGAITRPTPKAGGFLGRGTVGPLQRKKKKMPGQLNSLRKVLGQTMGTGAITRGNIRKPMGAPTRPVQGMQPKRNNLHQIASALRGAW